MSSSDFYNAFQDVTSARYRKDSFDSLARLSKILGIKVLSLIEVSLGYKPSIPHVLCWDISQNIVGVSSTHHYAMQKYHRHDEAMQCLNRIPEWIDVTTLRTLDPYSDAITKEMADDFNLHETYMTTMLTDVGTISAIMLSGPENSINLLNDHQIDQYRALCQIVMKKPVSDTEVRAPSNWPSREKRVWEAMHLIADGASRKEIAHNMDISLTRVTQYTEEVKSICAQFNDGKTPETREAQIILKILGFGDKFPDLMRMRL